MAGASLSITIPGPPVPKGRPRVALRGGRAMAYTPGKTRRYEDLIRLEAGRAMEGRAMLAGPLSVEVRAFLAIPKSLNKAKRQAALEGALRPVTRPDCDNYAKTIDALNGIAWQDDSQVVTLLVTKHYSEHPRLEFAASEMAVESEATSADLMRSFL